MGLWFMNGVMRECNMVAMTVGMKRQFVGDGSLSTMWFLVIELRLAGLAAGAFATEPNLACPLILVF